MRIEYDQENSQSVLHLDVEELATLLFALDIATVEASNSDQQLKCFRVRKEITEKLKG